MKRLFDVIGAIWGLLFIALFTPFIALAIIFEDGWPFLIKLDRVSEGRVIKIYKFRTMVKNAAELKPKLMNLNERKDGPFFKIKNDPRVTKVGRVLRKLRLDEFPQVINVLKNEISLVGPRPYPPEEIEAYPAEFKMLAQAKGGITGLSQVRGASKLSARRTMELDLYYLQHQSFWLDLKIIFKTIWIFFSDPTGI